MPRILLAIDLEDQSSALKAGQKAAMLARSEGASLELLVVLPAFGFPIVGQAFDENHEKVAHNAAMVQLKSWADAYLPSDVPRELHIAHGKIYDEIIRHADKLDVSTIVMGAHRPEFSDYLLGPNAARVVRHAKQSVFVVRHP